MCHSFVPSFIHKALNEHLLLGIMLGAGEIEMDISRFLTTGNSSSKKKHTKDTERSRASWSSPAVYMEGPGKKTRRDLEGSRSQAG